MPVSNHNAFPAIRKPLDAPGSNLFDTRPGFLLADRRHTASDVATIVQRPSGQPHVFTCYLVGSHIDGSIWPPARPELRRGTEHQQGRPRITRMSNGRIDGSGGRRGVPHPEEELGDDQVRYPREPGLKSLILRVTLRNMLGASSVSTVSRRSSGLPLSRSQSSQGTASSIQAPFGWDPAVTS